MVGDEDHGSLLDRDRDPLRRRLRTVLPRLHLLPALSEPFDQWTQWLLRTRFEGRSDEEVNAIGWELRSFRDTVLDNAVLRSGDVVVDVGAGTGLLTIGAAQRVAPDGDVLAVDISVDALEVLRGICRAPNVFYLVGMAEVLPLPDESVDAVVMRSVLVYVHDKAEAAREFFRVLRAGGRVSIFEPINRRNVRLSEVVDFDDLQARVEEWERAHYEDPDDPMVNFDERDLERVFRDAGFQDVSGDLRTAEGDVSAERTLHTVGAPGRLSLFDTWREDFPADVFERLVAAVRAHGVIHRARRRLYLTARKP